MVQHCNAKLEITVWSQTHILRHLHTLRFNGSSQSIKLDIGKSFNKLTSIDKLILNGIDFIGQLIKNRYSHTDEVLILPILSESSIVIELIKINLKKN